MIVEFDKARKEERAALEYLDANLPKEWLITSPVDLPPEIDGIVLCSSGILTLEYKNHGGAIMPQATGTWLQNGQPFQGGNNTMPPFQQANLAAKKLKGHLEQRFEGPWPTFIAGLVVLTNPSASLNVSNLEPMQARRVCTLADAPARIRSLLKAPPVFADDDLAAVVDSVRYPAARGLRLQGVGRVGAQPQDQESQVPGVSPEQTLATRFTETLMRLEGPYEVG
jgi:hypothetical protein